MNPHNYIDKRQLFADRDRLRQIANENRLLLIKINTINRTKGFVDSYNPGAYEEKSRWRKHELDMFHIEKENKKVHKKIVSAVGIKILILNDCIVYLPVL